MDGEDDGARHRVTCDGDTRWLGPVFYLWTPRGPEIVHPGRWLAETTRDPIRCHANQWTVATRDTGAERKLEICKTLAGIGGISGILGAVVVLVTVGNPIGFGLGLVGYLAGAFGMAVC